MFPPDGVRRRRFSPVSAARCSSSRSGEEMKRGAGAAGESDGEDQTPAAFKRHPSTVQTHRRLRGAVPDRWQKKEGANAS